MSRVGQLQEDKIRIGRKVRKVKDFSSQGGLDVQELPGEHRLKKVVRQLGKPRRNSCAYLPLRKSDERRFLQVGGRISQCLAAEHRLIKGCEKGCSATREYSKSKNPSLLFACRLGFVFVYRFSMSEFKC